MDNRQIDMWMRWRGLERDSSLSAITTEKIEEDLWDITDHIPAAWPSYMWAVTPTAIRLLVYKIQHLESRWLTQLLYWDVIGFPFNVLAFNTLLFFQAVIQLFDTACGISCPLVTDWSRASSNSVTDTDKTAWLTLCLGSLTHISVSHCVVEIILEQPSNFSWDFQTKSYNTSISNVQDICICFYTLATHWRSINTDGLEFVQFPKVWHKAQ